MNYCQVPLSSTVDTESASSQAKESQKHSPALQSKSPILKVSSGDGGGAHGPSANRSYQLVRVTHTPETIRRAKQWTMIMQQACPVLGSLLDLLDVSTAIELKNIK